MFWCKGKRNNSLCLGKPQYSAFGLDSSLNNVIYYDAYRLLVSGSGCFAVLIAILFPGLIDLKIIIENPAGQLCSTISCFYVDATLLCVIVSGKKNQEKIVACHRHKSKW